MLLYRQILRAAKRFPSIKRHAIVADIKAEFREGRGAGDAEEVRRRMEAGIRSLEQLGAYGQLDAASADWAVYLRGPT